MRHRTLQFTVAFALTSLLITGCTKAAWYESIQSGAERECTQQPAGAREECLDRLNKRTYQEYEKERPKGE